MQDDDSIEESEEDDQSTHTDKSRALSGIQRYLSHHFQKIVDYFYQSKSRLAFGRPVPFRNFVGPDAKTAPHNDTVVWNLVFLVMFFTSLCLAARFPTKELRIAFISISGFVFIALLVSVSVDIANRGKSKRTWLCRKIEAHYTTRRPKVPKKPWQHYTDCAPHHTLDDGLVFLHMVSRIK